MNNLTLCGEEVRWQLEESLGLAGGDDMVRGLTAVTSAEDRKRGRGEDLKFHAGGGAVLRDGESDVIRQQF